MTRRRAVLRWLLIAGIQATAGGTLCAAAPSHGAAPAVTGPKTYTSFAELRNDVLNAIGAATQRIWLTTDFLTDGEIVSQLYVAQYRKLDVQVLLGRAKANSYMSRLNYLKNQNIPVYLRPDGFKPGHATALLCDDKLYYIDGELDFMTRYKKFTLETPGPGEVERFAAAFSGAVSLKVPALARPIPLVGRAGGGGRHGAGAAYMPPPGPRAYDQSESGVFTYDHRSTPRPEGVPAKLPKSLKWEQMHQKAAGAPAGTGATPPPELPNGVGGDPETNAKDGGD